MKHSTLLNSHSRDLSESFCVILVQKIPTNLQLQMETAKNSGTGDREKQIGQ